MDENNEQFVAYFLPTPDTLQTRMEEEKESADFDPEQESVKSSCVCSSTSHIISLHVCRYEYTLTREYNWNVKNKASKGYEV